MKLSVGQGLQLKEQAYNYLKKAIITCKLRPGSNISETEIALEMGISRTPVREAILRLSQEGFIMIYPRRGMVVSPITVQDIHEVFQIRKMIEPYTAVRVSKIMSRDYLLKINDKFNQFISPPENGSYEEYLDLDLEFHQYIIESSKNKKLIGFMKRIYELEYRIKALSTIEPEDVEERSKPEHNAIIEALLDNNESEIERLLNVHLDNALTAALRRLY